MFATRSFSVIGPEIWKNLPDKLDNYSAFKKDHKTHLFKVEFNNLVNYIKHSW